MADVCLTFKNCQTDAQIVVRLLDGLEAPATSDMNKICTLAGDPALLDKDWQLLNICDCTSVDYDDVTITHIYNCTVCPSTPIPTPPIEEEFKITKRGVGPGVGVPNKTVTLPATNIGCDE